ncbi:MAG: 50S ribosomal protein L6 [Deltaproteobacteria bacterium HGW-Deltaproteobacteria-19]|jgi:large subunit ribosomal protein L6|nr:MAG: 50S ribosomal protein L6 [Deltaproteobacteria bacterium HGW-Deltaproteobacteria-19]
MSRIGKKQIALPDGVKVHQEGDAVRVDGPKGVLSASIPKGIQMIVENKQITIQRNTDNRYDRSFHGLTRTLVANMVTGVSAGFEKKLEIAGVGYRAELVENNRLKLIVGYSSPLEYVIPEGISVKIDKQVNLLVTGIDKQLVGRVAAEIRALRKPEPYKGKGIRYTGETVRRKVGKSIGSK